MYGEQTGQPSMNAKTESIPEFISLGKRLEEEGSRFYNLANELLRKADGIKRFTDNPKDPEAKSQEPNDFISKIWYDIVVISKQNDKLQYLLDHLNKII